MPTPVSTVAVTGANRGIGLELARQYAEAGHAVIAACRNPRDADEVHSLARDHAVEVHALDLAQGDSIDAFAAALAGRPIDLLINNAGTMGPLPLAEHIGRQKFGSLDYELWAQILLTNTIGTVHLTEALADNVAAASAAGRMGTIVMMSSTTGSISESDRPAIAYTTSKTALNKATTLIAATLRPRGVIVVAVCPGHVKTRLGIGGAEVEVVDSVTGIRELLEGLTMADTGTFRRYNGETIGW